MKTRFLTLTIGTLMLFAGVLNAAEPFVPGSPFEQTMVTALSFFYNVADAGNGNLNAVRQSDGDGSIAGRVVSGGRPIKGAKVFCWKVTEAGAAAAATVTGNDGTYSLRALEAGEYYVVASAPNYAVQFYRNARTPFDAEVVSVNEQGAVTGIDFNLKRLPSGKGCITGTVVDEQSGTPIAGAWIMAFSRQQPMSSKNLFAVSDASGTYKIDSVADDVYLVAAYANGYLPEFYDNAPSPVRATPVAVKGVEVNDVNFSLDKGGAISGKVQTDLGSPLAGVQVFAESLERTPIEIPGLTLLRQTAVTDAEGNYRISGLPAGRYRVSARTVIGGFAVVKFYNEKTRPQQADPVTVEADRETTGIDFTFTQTTGRISGTVKDSTGNPISGAFVTFVYRNDGDEKNWAKLRVYAQTDEAGRYELANLRPGTYYVGAWIKDGRQFKGVWYDGAATLREATAIVLASGQQVEGIDFVLDTATDYGAVSGTVRFEDDDSPVANAVVQAVPIRGNRSIQARKPSELVTFTDENGAYRLHPLYEGDYFILVRHNGYVEYYNDKGPRDADTVRVAAGTETANIDFRIPPAPSAGSIISGTVTDEATGAPISRALVTLFPAKRPAATNNGQWSRMYYSAYTDADGAYRIAGISTGSYILSFWARGYVGEFYNDVQNPKQATFIELSGTDERSGLDAALRQASGSRGPIGGMLAGAVQDENGEGIDQVMVCAVDENGDIAASTLSAPDGSFALTELESGDYRLMIARPTFETTYYPNGDQTLAVDSGDPADTPEVTVRLFPDRSTSVAGSMSEVKGFSLEQNYPNPFNPTTTISYRLPNSAAVSLKIYNLQGQWIATLVDQLQPTGEYKVQWNGKNHRGVAVPSGVYFYELQADDAVEIKMMTILK